MQNRFLASILFALTAGCSEIARSPEPTPTEAAPAVTVARLDTAPDPAPSGCAECKECKEGDAPTHVQAPADSNERVPVSDLGIVLGDARGEHTVVVFTDMQCPFCAKHHKKVEAFLATHPKGYRVVIRQRPLPFHEQAGDLARAAIAADRLGKGAPFMAAAFIAAQRDAKTALDVAAREVGLDPAGLRREGESSSIGAQLASDQADADRLDVKGTPTSFIDGRRIAGARPNIEEMVTQNQR